jgi:fatty acid hydroxylase family protein
MHSLHHSDRVLNVSTTQRHFWAEQAIKSATIYLAVGLLFRTNHRILVIYGVLSFWNFVSHMNLRLGFGPAWFILNSPQFHRVLRSCRREHYDRNFAALFTIGTEIAPYFEVVMRTARELFATGTTKRSASAAKPSWSPGRRRARDSNDSALYVRGLRLRYLRMGFSSLTQALGDSLNVGRLIFESTESVLVFAQRLFS